ncbi:MAG: hypothetical protein WDN00_14310 [Limisphaerales bacterium]
MIEQMLMPLSKQLDEGFGAVGRSFQESADYLSQNSDTSGRWMHGHLPINYLYRHAIELYLKSIIIIAHRRLRITSDDGSYDSIPKIKLRENFKPIYNVHGIRPLFDAMKQIFVFHRDAVSKIAKTDWSAIPKDLDSSIAIIDRVDPASTVFRYPHSNSPEIDVQKSSFKEVNTDDLLARMHSDGPKQLALMIVNKNNEVVETFALDDKPMPELREALVNAAEILSGAQFGVMMELGKTNA